MKKDESFIKRTIISFIIFILFILLVFYIIFRKNDFKTIYLIIKSTRKSYLLIGIFCMASFSICEALNIRRTLKLFGDKITFFNAYKYALGGFFASSITPSASGGDPAQIYLMVKDKIPVSHSVIALLMKLLAFQFVTITASIFCYLTSYNLFSNLGSVRFLIYLGIFLNGIVLILYLFLIFYKKIIVFLVELFCKILNKFHYQKTEILYNKINVQIQEYEKVSRILKKNKKVFLLNILTTYIQMFLYYSIAYFVYLSFGLNYESILTFIAIQSVLFISVSFLPLPGAVGASEATFMMLYKSIYGEALLGSAMLITRFINFYIFVFYSGLIFFVVLLKNSLKKK